MRIVWTRGALRSLSRICSYIAEHNPSAAQSIAVRIRSIVRRLSAYPFSARAGRVTGTRELMVSGTAYIVVYRIAGTTVEIVRVVHGAQQWPGSFDLNGEEDE